MPRYDRNVIDITPARMAMLTEEQQACIQSIEAQEAFWNFYYYSKINFEFTRVGAPPGPYTYVLARGETPTAFSYGIGTAMTRAGFLAVDGDATRSETNLLRSQETRAGESVHIRGISLLPMKGGSGDPTVAGRQMTGRYSDSRGLAQVMTNASIRLLMNGGSQQFEIGLGEFLPSAGGLLGDGPDQLATQAIPGGRLPFSFAANGWPISSNYFPMPEGLLWTPKGDADSALEIEFNVDRAITLDSGGDPDNPAPDEAPVAGVRGYNYPEVLYAQLMVFLIGETITPRSRVQ